jgi:hypothetical protein
MTFRLVQAQFDRNSERGYVELRDDHDDGGDMIVVALFSFRTNASLSKHQIEQDIVRKARHMLKRAVAGL